MSEQVFDMSEQVFDMSEDVTNHDVPLHKMQTGNATRKPQLILACAALTALDEQGRIVGRLDVPVSDSGIEHSRQNAVLLAEAGIKALFRSPGVAADQTVVALSEIARVKIRVEDSLANVDHGLWHGKLIREIRLTQPRLFRMWKDQPDTFSPPEGESGLDVRDRIGKALRKICKRAKTNPVAIVAPEPLYSIVFDELQTLAADLEWTELPKCERIAASEQCCIEDAGSDFVENGSAKKNVRRKNVCGNDGDRNDGDRNDGVVIADAIV